MFADKIPKKTYWAIVKNMPLRINDSLTHWLVKNPKNNKSKAFLKEVTASKKAILHYKTIKQLERS